MTRLHRTLLLAPLAALAPLAPLTPASVPAQDDSSDRPVASATEQDEEMHLADNPLDALERLVGGQWRPVDFSMLNEYSRYTWGAGRRSLLVSTWQVGDDGLDPASAAGILYWDPAKESIVGTVVLDESRIKEIVVELGERRWDFRYDYYSGGNVNQMIDSFGWDEDGSYQMQVIIGGETPLEWLNLRCAREEESAAALPIMPMDPGESARMGSMERMMGNWKATTTDADGAVTSSRSVIYWGLDRSLALFRTLESREGEEVPVADGLFYWSPETSSIRLVSVGEDGAVYRGSLVSGTAGLECDFVRVGKGDEMKRYQQVVTFPEDEAKPGFTVEMWSLEGDERTKLQTTVFEPAG